VDDLLEPVGVFVNLRLNLGLSVLQQCLEGQNHFQITSRCHVVLSSKILVELGRPLLSAHMEELQDLGTFVPDVLIHVHVGDRFLGNRRKSLLGPFEEPVDCATVHQRGKLSYSGSEGISNRREAQHQMQVLLDLFDEEGVQLGGSGFAFAGCPGGLGNQFLQFDSLFHVPDVGHFVGVEEIVDVLDVAFVFDLRVREEKDGGDQLAS
jgi:hypothetical protein